jgi:hypothetical protein
MFNQRRRGLFKIVKKTYSEKLKDPRWQKVRLKVMERDGFTCRDCGSIDKTLHVHHSHYCKGEPWETPAKFMLTLCDECHEERGQAEARAKSAFSELLALISFSRVATLSVNLESYLSTDNPDPFNPRILSGCRIDYLAHERWKRYFAENPAGRDAYEKVTGFRPDWRELEQEIEAWK